MLLTDRQQWWFNRFSALKAGDTVRFGWFELVVFCVHSYGGCTFGEPGGEYIPATSRLWDEAEVIGKEFSVYAESPIDDHDPADDWKKCV